MTAKAKERKMRLGIRKAGKEERKESKLGYKETDDQRKGEKGNTEKVRRSKKQRKWEKGKSKREENETINTTTRKRRTEGKQIGSKETEEQ